jgi:hypothetical protein
MAPARTWPANDAPVHDRDAAESKADAEPPDCSRFMALDGDDHQDHEIAHHHDRQRGQARFVRHSTPLLRGVDPSSLPASAPFPAPQR